MTLKFLQKDDRVPFIADAVEMYEEKGLPIINDLYKKGKMPALLLVDFQNTFTSPESPLGAKGVSDEIASMINGAVENTGALIDAMHEKSFPVIYTYSIMDREDAAEIGPLREKAVLLMEFCKKNSKWVELDDRLPPPNNNDFVIVKKAASAFIGTNLLNILSTNNIDTCIIAGNSTGCCVKHNTIVATGYGYCSVIPEECVFDPNAATHKTSLFDIAVKTADVTSVQDILEWLSSLR